MNKVILMGRLTKSPEIHYSQGSGTTVARYTLAVNRPYRRDGEEQQADFIRCVTFGKSAEFAEKYLYKGIKIAIVGRIQSGSYEHDGRTVYTTDIIVESHDFCESKSKSCNNNSDNCRKLDYDPANANGFMNVPDGIDDELPFA